MKNTNSIRFLSFLCSLLFSAISFSQDTIVKLNGEQVLAKIMEITNEEIKYKKSNFLDGPTYVEKKTSVQAIKYSNGNIEMQPFQPAQLSSAGKTNDSIPPAPPKTVTDDYYGKYAPQSDPGEISISRKVYKQQGNIISEDKLHDLLNQTNNKEITSLVEKAKKAKKRQLISFGCMLGGTSFLVFYPAFFLVEPPFIFSFYFNRALRKSYNKKAIELYNRRHGSKGNYDRHQN